MATDPDQKQDQDREERVTAALCARYREWAPAEPAAPRPGARLDGGHSNHTRQLRGALGSYALRIGAQCPPPGVDRHRECAAATAAAGRGIAPPLLLCEPGSGVMITRFVGCPAGDDIATAGIAELAQLLRAIHSLPATGAAVCSAVQLRSYRERLRAGSPAATLLEHHGALLERSLNTVATHSDQPRLCHNDLLPANLRRWEGRLIALDWEYAAPGDPFFDLAVAVSGVDSDSAAILLEAYLQRAATADERRRYGAQRAVYAALECCWHEVHGGATTPQSGASRERLAALLAAGNRQEITA